MKNWIQGAIKRPGAFTKKADSAGMTVAAYARKVLGGSGHYDTRTRRQAQLALTLRKMRK